MIVKCARWPEVDYSLASAMQEENLFSTMDSRVYAADRKQQTGEITRPPIRTIRDVDPIYSGVAVDTQFDEVVLMDQNKWGIRVFNRTDNTPPGVPFTEPKRWSRVRTPTSSSTTASTSIPRTVTSTRWKPTPETRLSCFPAERTEISSRAASCRLLIAASPWLWMKRSRSFSSASSTLLKWRYTAKTHLVRTNRFAASTEKALGYRTSTASLLDTKNKLMFVVNWGHVSDYTTAGTGRFEDPSISVYPINADGDTAPLRVIQGPKTQLNWPAQMTMDPDTGDLFVANDMGQSVLVFDSKAQGDVAPTRIIKGNKTRLCESVGCRCRHEE